MKPNPIRWLYGELPGLVQRDVLTADAADSLRRHYGPLPEAGTRRILFLVFGVLGALLVGSGVVLLLAHNWEQLSRPARAALAVAPLILAQGIAGWTAVRRMDSPAWTEGSATLLSLAVVACISLISQTYNIGGDLQALLLIWVVSTLPLAYLLRSRVAATLSWIGATWWWMLGPWPAVPLSTYSTYGGFVVLAIPFFAWLHAEHRHEPRSALVGWAVCGSLSVALIRLAAWPEIGLWAPLFAGLLGSMYAFGVWRGRSGRDEIAAWCRPFHVVGALGLGALLIVCSFGDLWHLGWHWDRARAGLVPLIVAVGVALLLSLGSSLAGVRLMIRGEWERGALACTPVAIAVAWGAGFDHAYSTAIMLAMNLLALAIGIAFCARGIRSGRLGTANAGLLLVLAVLIARFFDADISFVARGVGFIVLGSGFLAMNAWLLRQRKEARS